MIIQYIDPGTGSLIISTIVGIVLTLLFSVKGLFYRLSYLFLGRGTGNLVDFSGEIVFFSEGKQYWRVYQPVIEEFVKKGQKIIYLSADKEDKGLSFESEFVEAHYLGNVKQAIFTLNRLKAKICVMTTPQLDVIALRRSENVDHYCHIIHSPTDIHAYKKFAFDFFDSVLCSSTAQIDNLRYLEKERNTQPKQLFETGCTYYDVFKSDDMISGDALLLAPTWGDRTFFKSSGKEILNYLLESGHKVIFRPHPQSWISDKGLMDEIVSEFGSNSNLTIDKETSGENAIRNSKLLICDISSGMVFDMAFVYKKPVVAVEFDWADGGYESSDLQNKSAAIELLKDVGGFINPSEIKEISKVVDEASKKLVSQEIIDQHIFNFQRAGKTAADQIVSIYKEI
jgi:hypothetical protein|tara:strand:- start:9277 stop:10470 length:1194 start_codon:yes stop_codon:yes gene_type:complete